jgi:hypothetical protein
LSENGAAQPGPTKAIPVPSQESNFDPLAAVNLASQNIEQVKESVRALEEATTVRQDDLRMQFSV